MNRRISMQILSVWAVVLCLAGSAWAGELVITHGLGKQTVVKKVAEKHWEAVEDGKTYTVAFAEDNSVEFKTDAAVIAAGKFKGDKIAMETPDGIFYLTVKLKADKTKFSLEEGDGIPTWDFKKKEDKVKVVRGEDEYGKVKFYADTGKLKVKNKGEMEIAVARGAEAMVAGPGAFLVTGLDAQKRNFILLTLFALGK